MSPEDQAPRDPSPTALGRSFELLSRYQDGDREALDELIARYVPRLHSLARRRMTPAQRKLAGGSMDVVHDTFIAALHALGEFEFKDADSLARYLSVVMQNRLTDLSRKGGRRPREISIDPGEDAGTGESHEIEPVDREPSPYDTLSHQEYQEIHAECTASMDEPERTILILREVGGATWEELAAEVGSPTAHAARVRYDRAKAKRDLKIMHRVSF